LHRIVVFTNKSKSIWGRYKIRRRQPSRRISSLSPTKQ